MRKHHRTFYSSVIAIGLLLFNIYFLFFHWITDPRQPFFRQADALEEAKHIVFLKVHKTGSSTVQNIFLRFGTSRNLTFVIPDPHKTSYPNIISLSKGVTSENILPKPAIGHFDISCCHVIYNRSAFDQIMPKDTFYIGIVRRPFEHFRSSLNYFRSYTLNNSSRLSHFLSHPTHPENAYISGRGSFIINRMAYEYNFPEVLYKRYNRKTVKDYLKTLDSEFNLMIVAELMDESLVLMKRMLKWQLKDIIYKTTNTASRKDLRNIKFRTGDAVSHRLVARLDYDLYDYFTQRLLKQINLAGSDFLQEVSHFRTILQDVKAYCWVPDPLSNYTVEESPWNDKFTVDYDDCVNMDTFEIDYILRIRKRQYNS